MDFLFGSSDYMLWFGKNMKCKVYYKGKTILLFEYKKKYGNLYKIVNDNKILMDRNISIDYAEFLVERFDEEIGCFVLGSPGSGKARIAGKPK